MKNRAIVPIPVVVTIVVALMASLACSITAGTPSVNNFLAQPTITSVAPNSQPTSAPGKAGTALPTLQSQATAGPIPGTSSGPSGTTAGQPPKNLEAIYANSNPGVVSILVQVNQGGQSGQGAGSGFVLDNNGHIVTNHHVIDGASTIVVRFYNNADTEAKVIGDDPNSDLAILEVTNKAQGIHPLPLGDSSKVAVGDSVVAIGNPFALGTSMSYGIVSAIGRTIPSGFTPYNIPQAIQTDAAINPGNSGGPLIDMNGEVIGINAQIQTGGTGNGSVGIGFAIPVNILRTIAPDLIAKGSYNWPYLGVSQSVNPLSINAGNAQQQQGALIDQVTQGGPADQGGMQQGDVVIQADNEKITSFDDLLTFVAFKHPGDKVTLIVLRGNQQKQLTVTLGTRPNTPLQPNQ